MELTIGADPEFFVRKGRHFISGHTFDCGTKEKPMETKHGTIQMDGIALECNVKPSATKEEFIQNVRGVTGDLRALVKSSDAGAELVARPTIFFGTKKLSALPKHVGKLGCTPDFNAYTKSQIPAPNGESPFRTGAGHIHLGWTNVANPRNKKHFDDCCSLVKELDYYLGLPSLLWDNDVRRRKMYGRAGAFRPKPYGLEYRVLSNKWLETSGLVGFVFEQAMKCFNEWRNDIRLATFYGTAAEEWINTSFVNWRSHTPGLADRVLYGEAHG